METNDSHTVRISPRGHVTALLTQSRDGRTSRFRRDRIRHINCTSEVYLSAPRRFDARPRERWAYQYAGRVSVKIAYVAAGLATIVAVGVTIFPAPVSASEPDAGGVVKAWGAAYPGGDQSPLRIPAVLADQTVTRISAGSSISALALTATNSVVAWGSDNGNQTAVPAELQGQPLRQLAAGGWGYNAAVTENGRLFLWGDRIGEGAAEIPDAVRDSFVTQIAPGYTHVAALTDTGQVHVWGAFTDGKTPCDDAARIVPEELSNEDVVGVWAGSCYTIVTTRSGKIVGWPQSASAVATIPQDLDPGQIRKLAAGYYHVNALLHVPDENGNRVISWGLPDRTTIPADVQTKDIVDISTGNMHTVYLTATGDIGGWGRNESGQLDFPADQKWTAISAGYNWTMGIAVPAAQ